MVEVLVKKMNFTQSMNDQCLLMRNEENVTIIICSYIDYLLYVGDKKPSTYSRKKLKNILLQRKKEKQMTMLGA